MKNKEIFHPGQIVQFHTGSPTVKVLWMHEDNYLFKGTIIASDDDTQIGVTKRSFYRHKFYPVPPEF